MRRSASWAGVATCVTDSVLMWLGLMLQMICFRTLFCLWILLNWYTDVGGWLRLASNGRGRKMKKWRKGGGVVYAEKRAEEAPAGSTWLWVAQFKWLHSRMHQSEALPLLWANVVLSTWCLWSRLLARWFVLTEGRTRDSGQGFFILWELKHRCML